MITHTGQKAVGTKAGEIVSRRVQISQKVKAEVILDDGQHELRDIEAGEIVNCPIWSAKDLVGRKMAVYV